MQRYPGLYLLVLCAVISPLILTAQSARDTPREIALDATILPGHALQDDGLGPYLNGKDEQEVYLNHKSGTRPTVFALVVSGHSPARFHRYDLTRPVADSGAVSMGLFKGSGGDDFFMASPVNATIATLDAMSIGATVDADSFEIRLGQGYSLVFGSVGAFYGQGGSGTSKARVTRPSAKEWQLMLPPGSRGRLWHRPGATLEGKQFVDKGLYEFDGVVTLVARE